MDEIIMSLFWGIFGLIIGSFLNVVIYRVPRGESIVKPGSHCTQCNHALKAWELVPVLSFIALRGQCHSCGTKISWRYPGVELLTGLLFFLWAWRNPAEPLPVLGLHFILLAVLLALALIDWDTMRLPDVLTLPLLTIGIGSSFFLPMGLSGGESLASAIGAGGAFWLIAKIYPQGMGLGDVKLIAGMGAFLGFPNILLALFIASLIGSIIGLLWMVIRGREFRAQIPFGPFLVLGAYATLFGGDCLIQAYLTLF
ncbi:type 4 prepilin peptidase 1 [Desulfitobacterium metallireducens DSM 15288]|uniref:Prepilin leader peptidase/N-methyltransferase n=2 Tax=Desulfitobacterium TaxID=36853 RepID=W0E9H3_9FIRM|nr:type 4 prepilin peptidase 1 [Desulfitobacterium metallireducens DSM 15288]